VIAERIEEQLGPLRRRERAGLAALAVLILTGAVFWYVRSLPKPVAITTPGGEGTRPAVAVASPSPSPAVVFVHVVGRVRRPGVYELHEGDRVIDAIRAAGGAKQDADLRSINLAALLADGEQIIVWKRGAPGDPFPVSGPAGSSGSSGAGGPPALINVNTATLDQLESLPGIGPALGQRIIDYREQHGPFASVDDLLNVSGIGDQRLADLRPLVTV
jgi:competence protein ComEA